MPTPIGHAETLTIMDTIIEISLLALWTGMGALVTASAWDLVSHYRTLRRHKAYLKRYAHLHKAELRRRRDLGVN